MDKKELLFNAITVRVQGSTQEIECGEFYVIQKENDYYFCGISLEKPWNYVPLGKYSNKKDAYRVLKAFAWYGHVYTETVYSIVFIVPEEDVDMTYQRYLLLKANRRKKADNYRCLSVKTFKPKCEYHQDTKLGIYVNSYFYDIGGYEVSAACVVLDGVVVDTGDEERPFEIGVKDRNGNKLGRYLTHYNSIEVECFLTKIQKAVEECKELIIWEGDEVAFTIDFKKLESEGN